MTTPHLIKSIGGSPLRLALLLILLVFACFALSRQSQAANTPNTPDPGPLPISNTADGDLALAGVTGIYNSAFGIYALLSNGAANFNTGVGADVLLVNTADENTGVGAATLFSNTAGINNTGNGAFALFSNTTGLDNTAVGNRAMQSNIDGSRHTAVGSHALFNCIAPPGKEGVPGNTAVGASALFSDTIGNLNTAMGDGALFSNTTGSDNTANGVSALAANTEGSVNTAIGFNALVSNTEGETNTAAGGNALFNNTTGTDNIAIGFRAGYNLTTGNNNVEVGDEGDASDSNTIRIGNASHERILIPAINNIVLGAGLPVTIDSTTGLLGVATSSQRFKDNIKPMDKASEALLGLKPVTFQYKSDSKGTPQFGLIAEEVAKVDPDLVVRDRNREIYSVRYEAVNAMLLNEFLKEHRKVEDLEANAARQQKQIEALTAGLQKVRIQPESSKPAPQVVNNP